MTYRIVITAVEPNPDYEKQLEAAKQEEKYSGRNYAGQQIAWPVSEREVKRLETVLTEAEFNAARKAILESM